MKTSKNSKNYKVRCTGFNAKERCFTKGKVYEVKDGIITSDRGFTYNRLGNEPDVIKYLKPWYNFEVVEEKVEYKVGDRVIIEESNIECITKYAGKTGTIVDVNHDFKHPYCVLPDEKKNVWTRGGIWCYIKCYAPEEKELKEEKIVITHDGKTTTATMYRGDMKHVGTARCCPEDTFDFKYGAKLAMERMMKEVDDWDKKQEPKFTKYEEGQFVRVVQKHTHHFPLGQIVKVVEHKTGFFDEEGIIMCEGFCENVNMISIQCVLPEEIAPLD